MPKKDGENSCKHQSRIDQTHQTEKSKETESSPNPNVNIEHFGQLNGTHHEGLKGGINVPTV